MKSKRHQLILLGLFCQGMASDSLGLTAVYFTLWFLFTGKIQLKSLNPIWEGLLLLLGLVLSYKVALSFGYSRFIFMGNGLAVLQFLRLARPLSKEQKSFTIIIAITHISVGTLVLFDSWFIIALILAFVLLPKALFEMEMESFVNQSIAGSSFTFQKKDIVFILTIAFVFFLFFPRTHIDTNNLLIGGQLPPDPLQDNLDSSASNDSTSNQLIFQIEGQDITYLKKYSLDKFDGRFWKVGQDAHKARERLSTKPDDNARLRKIKVNNVRLLGASIPFDGNVKSMQGNYFKWTYRMGNKALIIKKVKAKANYHIKYWSTDELDTELSRNPTKLAELTYFGKPSAKLKKWLKEKTKDFTDPVDKANKLANYFHENFTYKMGTYNLNRLSPLEDFIFNSKEGHCERYASALAVLLRMEGIPSRVAVGFMATEKNDFAGLYNIREQNAHAWTEAWIPNSGWQTFDATPATEDFNQNRNNLGLSLYEWAKYFWYSNIISFSRNEQKNLLLFSQKQFSAVFNNIGSFISHKIILYFCLILVIIFVILKRKTFIPKTHQQKREDSKQESRGFYAKLMAILKKQNLTRQANQTPLEFVSTLSAHPAIQDIEHVTDYFTKVFYAEKILTENDKKNINLALEKIAQTNIKNDN